MRRLSQKRLLRLASLILTGLTVVFGILWVVRGLRPAIECGVLDALGSGAWSAAFACVDQADYEALLFVVGLAASLVTWLASRKAPDTPRGEYHPTPDQHARNREAMIERVSRIVEDRRDQSLYQAVLLSLGMTWRAAVSRPGSLSLHKPDEQEQDIPADTPIIQLFEDAQRRLLILGEPGSGKSTMALELARSLLQQARSDSKVLIPVFLNLASLTDPEQSVEDWLVCELSSSYVVPDSLARYWLDHDELALLLDGLDEVRAECRASAVEKLNGFRSRHLAPWLVICCRNTEYTELISVGSALQDVDAIVLRPLTRKQTEDYLVGLDGPEPQRLWDALQKDEALLELADTPLMLNVMLLAADELDWDALPRSRTSKAARSLIYNAYIQGMLARPRSTGRRYADAKTLHWLHWLAGKMAAHSQTVFLLERMKRSWFNDPLQRYLWILVFPMVFGSVFGSVFGLITMLLSMSLFGLLYGLAFGIGTGLVFGLVFGWGDINVREQIDFMAHRDKLVNMARLMLVFGFALCPGIYFGSVLELRDNLVVWSIIALCTGLSLALFLGLTKRFTRIEEDYRQNQPNFAIRKSFRSGLIGGLIGFLIGGLAFGMVGFSAGGLLLGLIGGLFVGMTFGWATVIKHYTLRLVLFLDGSMPLRYVPFLDYCVDRVLLRRVGGGYMFIHRTMMEHIAGLDLEKWKEQPDSP